MVKKILTWIPKNLGAIIGVLQAIVLFVHEVCVLALRILCPLIIGEKDDNTVKMVKSVTDKINGVLEKVKDYLLKVGM